MPREVYPAKTEASQFRGGANLRLGGDEGPECQAARAGSLGAGTAKHFTNPAQVLTFGGTSQTVADVQTRLGLVGSLRKYTVAAQATASAKVAAEDSQLPALLAFMSAYVAFVRASFGNTPDVLADFDLASKKAASKPDAETQLAAVAQAQVDARGEGNARLAAEEGDKGQRDGRRGDADRDAANATSGTGGTGGTGK